MRKTRELPSQEELLKIFYYDDCLRWRVDIKKTRRDIKAGDKVIGWKNGAGYSALMLDGKKYLLSRITYQTVYGNLTPDLVIDHIDRDTSNNKIENLRAVTRKHNLRNCKKRSDNSTGFCGVSFSSFSYLKLDGTLKSILRYKAQFHDAEGNLKVKYFNISKLGDEKALKLACEWREKMLKSLKDSGEWYDENHGI